MSFKRIHTDADMTLPFNVNFTLSVSDVYGDSPEGLKRNLTDKQRFIAFRPVKHGEHYLDTPKGKGFVWNGNGAVLVAATNLEYPRLIIGIISRRRIVFEEVWDTHDVRSGEYRMSVDGSLHRNNDLMMTQRAGRVFRIVEDSGE